MVSLRASKANARNLLAKLILLDATHRILESRGLKPNAAFKDLWDLAVTEAANKLAMDLNLKLKSKTIPGQLAVSATWKTSALFVVVTDKLREEALVSLPSMVADSYFTHLSEQPA